MTPVTVFNLSLTKTGFILLLKPEEGPAHRLLPILIGVPEAQSIALALAGKPTPRPMTHDLMKQLLEHLDVRLRRVEITRMEEHTFFARLLLERGPGVCLDVDARPSDAIALALRCRAPIWVAEEVFENNAVRVEVENVEEETMQKGEKRKTPDPRRQLEEEMKRAIQEERYEDAARIRDQLKQLDHH